MFDASGKKYLAHRRVMIDQPIAPGETRQLTLNLELQRPSNYVVEFSVMQDGTGWFVSHLPSAGRRYAFKVE